MSGTHPTPRELREWKRRLEAGQASTGMLDRVIEGYEALWRVMRAARKATIDWDHDENEMGQATADERISEALAPFADLEPEQMELEE